MHYLDLFIKSFTLFVGYIKKFVSFNIITDLSIFTRQMLYSNYNSQSVLKVVVPIMSYYYFENYSDFQKIGENLTHKSFEAILPNCVQYPVVNKLNKLCQIDWLWLIWCCLPLFIIEPKPIQTFAQKFVLFCFLINYTIKGSCAITIRDYS